MNRLLCLFLIFITASLSGFEDTMQTLLKLPEVRALMNTINQEGKITIAYGGSPQFAALWDADERCIWINKDKTDQDKHSLVSTLLFELHNAASNQEFLSIIQEAKTATISKDAYVEKVERMEHRNAMNTSTILEKAIRQRLFSKEVRWEITSDFEEHYAIQQLHGHSQWLAKNYDKLNIGSNQAYLGTLPKEYLRTKEDRSDYLRYLRIKYALKEESWDAIYWINKELMFFESCNTSPQNRICQRITTKKRLFDFVFVEQPL